MSRKGRSRKFIPTSEKPIFLARLITRVHSFPEKLNECLQVAQKTLGSSAKEAHVIGITGSAAAGKSTLIDKMITVLRSNDLTVVVLAIDPTETESGGAILADAVRMRDHYLDRGVFLRSFPSQGAPGALTTSLSQVIELVSLFADVIIVETVGAGQGDVALKKCVHTFITLPDSRGDELTLLKAGPHRHAHILAVNVREGSQDDGLFFSLLSSFTSGLPVRSGWRVVVFKVNAKTGEGVSSLMRDGVYTHRDFLKNS